MITLLNPSEIEMETAIIKDLDRFGLKHLKTKKDLGWNYILDHVWLTKNIEGYLKSIDKIAPIVLDVGCGNGSFFAAELLFCH